jgi:inward rectifier potassium channel
MSANIDGKRGYLLAALALSWRRFRSVVTRRETGGSQSRVMVGGYTVWLKGIARFDLRDTYHNVIALSWPKFLLTLVAVAAAINIAFASLYLAQPGAVANARPGSFFDVFFFSVETAATVGFGEMYPATVYGHIVCTAEIGVGMSFTALMTGLLFVRFSRPKAKIRYAQNAVIALHDGQPTLMIRIANGRRSLLYDAGVHLSLLLTSRGEQGEMLRRVHELRLARSRLPMFSLTWTLMHKIDRSSPLQNYDAARLIEADARLLLGVEARDVTAAAQVVDTKGYDSTQILFGMRYAGTMSFDAEGHPVADLSELSQLEPDTGPEPPQSGWDNPNWNEGSP